MVSSRRTNGARRERCRSGRTRSAGRNGAASVRAARLVGIYTSPDWIIAYKDGNKHQLLAMTFEAQIIDGTLGLSDETTDANFFTPEQIAAMDVVGIIRSASPMRWQIDPKHSCADAPGRRSSPASRPGGQPHVYEINQYEHGPIRSTGQPAPERDRQQHQTQHDQDHCINSPQRQRKGQPRCGGRIAGFCAGRLRGRRGRRNDLSQRRVRLQTRRHRRRKYHSAITIGSAMHRFNKTTVTFTETTAE